MSISVACLSELFFAQSALIWHFIIVNTKMVSQIAKLWELQWAFLTLKDLIHSLGASIKPMNQEVVTFILNLFVTTPVANANTITECYVINGPKSIR